jgi:hypothetical protein
MELNTWQQCNCNKGSHLFEIDYFFTNDKIAGTAPPPAEVWMVFFIKGSEDQKHCIAKSLSILRQAKEVIDIIARREALAFIDGCILRA